MTHLSDDIMCHRHANAELALTRLSRELNVDVEDTSLWEGSQSGSVRCIAYVTPRTCHESTKSRRIEVQVNFARNSSALMSYAAIDTETHHLLVSCAG